MKNQLILQNLAKTFCSEATDFLELSQAIITYRTLLLELTALDLDQNSFRSDLYFENGKVIGLTWAARCIDDMIRTKMFIKGVFDAVQSLKNPNRGPIHILYAGTGPFATLILPLLAHSSPDEIQVTLLEVNPDSLVFLKHVFDQLDFNRFVRSYVNEDATTYQIKEKVDILLSETMQRALQAEQQVPIFLNLINQIDYPFILIPERVILKLAKLKQLELSYSTEIISQVFELSSDRIKYILEIQKEKDAVICFPKIKANLIAEQTDELTQLAILTEIQVFGKNWIRFNQSGLTIPWIIEKNWPHDSIEKSMVLQYQISQNPGLKYVFEP